MMLRIWYWKCHDDSFTYSMDAKFIKKMIVNLSPVFYTWFMIKRLKFHDHESSSLITLEPRFWALWKCRNNGKIDCVSVLLIFQEGGALTVLQAYPTRLAAIFSYRNDFLEMALKWRHLCWMGDRIYRPSIFLRSPAYLHQWLVTSIIVF